MPNAVPLRSLVSRLHRISAIRAAAFERWEVAQSPTFRVRRLEVVRHVAERLGRAVSPALCREVSAAMRGTGWEAVRNGNRRLFRCCKEKAMPDDAALAKSRELLAWKPGSQGNEGKQPFPGNRRKNPKKDSQRGQMAAQ